MDRVQLESLARQLTSGELSVAAFLQAIAGEWGRESIRDGDFPLAETISPNRLPTPSTAELPDTTLDLDRARRCGFPEVVFGENKSAETLLRIVDRLVQEQVRVFVTRVAADKAEALCQRFPAAQYNPVARTFRLNRGAGVSPAEHAPKTGRVAVVTAGTSDVPVAEEARETLDWMGVETVSITDVGVAGPQRLLAKLPLIVGSDAVVVVAGMEGALPSVVGGHVDCPVIAVPTSVGYGANFGGIAALLTMLNSCAANVTVVNIDAGFKGGYIAGLIAHGKSKAK
ncbi:MAG TPA: nickel pincer cofactor biosynthesis protein LarB [Pirellulaceae bacterium]|nr:nickel pincer cofactor biosynthesis protein LarB [Pirellulaceae bacterium]